MFKSVSGAATKVAAVGILASSVCAVQLVSDQTNKVHDWNPDLSQEQTLLATRKQLDDVEEQLNQMKEETEVNLEIAEQESTSETRHGKPKRHSKKNKHSKKKNKNHRKVQQEEAEAPSVDDLGEEAVHAKKRHGHKKGKHSSGEAAPTNEEDPFDTFKESLTKSHHKGGQEETRQHKAGKKSEGKPQAEEKDAVLRQIDQIANDISVTQKNTATVQAKLGGHALTSTKSDVHLKSDPICNSAGCTQYLHPSVDGFKKDYFVPDFGKDQDITATEKSEKAAEEIVHKYDEQEMASVTEDMRMESKSDPICSSAGCDQYKHPHKDSFKMNYFVPSFGKDHDIVQSEKDAAGAEAALGHTWTPTYDEENDKWVVPTESAEFKLAGVAQDVQMGKHKRKHKHQHSDPSCTSSGWCGESLWPSHRAKDEEHAVLRSNTDRGANQVPTTEEAGANKQKSIDNASEPHPDSKGPTPEDQEEEKLDAKKSSAKGKGKETKEEGKPKESKASKESAESKTKKKMEEDKEEETAPEGTSNRPTSSLLKDDEYKGSHSAAQSPAAPQSFSTIKRSHHRRGDDDEEKPKKKSKKAKDDEDSCATRKGSSQISDDEWKKCHESLVAKNKHHSRKQKAHHRRNPKQVSSDPICSSSGWCGEPWPDHMKDKREVVEYKTGLPLDKDIRDTQEHIRDQEAEHGAWTLGKEPSEYRGQRHGRRAKNGQRLQTQVDVWSDPAFNSDDGYETRHMNPSDEKEIVKYKTDLPYDSDIATTQKNLKDMETREDHKFDPIPYLAQRASSTDEQEAQEQEQPVAPQPVAQPQPALQQSTSDQTTKTAVKTNVDTKQKVEAKAKSQTKQEKLSSFVAMRKSMMSNWGTK